MKNKSVLIKYSKENPNEFLDLEIKSNQKSFQLS
jgi:hypothetical protein